MAPQTYEPTFFLLKRRLPASESAHLLGRVIRRYEDPTLDYTPESPSTTLNLPVSPEPFTSFLLSPSHDHSAHFTTQLSHSSSRFLKFISLLSTSATSSATTTVTSPCIITRRLKREQAYFSALKSIPHVRRKILDMCPVGDKVYLVVGTMSVQSGTFHRTVAQVKDRSTAVALPLALAATAAGLGVGGVPIGPCAELIPDAEAGVKRADSSASTTSFSTVGEDGGEEVFAVACKVIRRSWRGFGGDVGMRWRQPEYRGGQHLGSDDEGSDSEEEASGEESELDEEVEEMIAQGLVLSDEGMEGVDMEMVFDWTRCKDQVGGSLDDNISKGEIVR